MNPTTVYGRIDFILSLKLLSFPITDLLFTLWNLKNRFPFILSNLVYSFTPHAIFTMTSRFWTHYSLTISNVFSTTSFIRAPLSITNRVLKFSYLNVSNPQILESPTNIKTGFFSGMNLYYVRYYALLII